MDRFTIMHKLTKDDLEEINAGLLEAINIELSNYFDDFKDYGSNPFYPIWKYIVNIMDLQYNPKYFYSYLFNQELYKTNNLQLSVNDKYMAEVKDNLYKAALENLFNWDGFYFKDAFYNVYYTLKYLLESSEYISTEKIIDASYVKSDIDLHNTCLYVLKNIKKMYIPINLKDVIKKNKGKSPYRISRFCNKLMVSIISNYSTTPWYNLPKTFKNRFCYVNMYDYYLKGLNDIDSSYLLERITGTTLAAKLFGIVEKHNLKDKISVSTLSYLADTILAFPNQYGSYQILDYVFEIFIDDSKDIIESDVLNINNSIGLVFNKKDINSKYYNISISLLYIIIKYYIMKNNTDDFDMVLKKACDDLQIFIERVIDVPRSLFDSDKYINFVNNQSLINEKVVNSYDELYMKLQKNIIINIYNKYNISEPDIISDSDNNLNLKLTFKKVKR